MILDKIYNRIKFKNLILFLVRIEDRDTISFRRYNLLFQKGQPSIESESELVSHTPTDLLNDIPQDIPVFLYILGKGSVHRLFEKEEIDEYSIEELFPNFNSELNYCIRSNVNSSQATVDFFRKRQIQEDIIDNYFKAVNVAGFIFGTAPIVTLLDYFDFEKSKVIFEGVKFKKIDSEYKAIKTTEQTERSIFNDKEYSNDSILAIAASIFVQLKLLPEELLNQQAVDIAVSSWLNKKIVPGILGTVFFILIINYFLFSSFSSKYQNKASQVAYGEQTLKKLETLKTQIKDNEDFIKDNNILYQSGYTFMVDHIGEVASKNVRLLRLQVHPLEKEISDGKEVKFSNQVVLLQGEATSVNKYKDFLAQLINLPRVKKITSQTYQFDEKKRVGEFSLQLEYELE